MGRQCMRLIGLSCIGTHCRLAMAALVRAGRVHSQGRVPSHAPAHRYQRRLGQCCLGLCQASYKTTYAQPYLTPHMWLQSCTTFSSSHSHWDPASPMPPSAHHCAGFLSREGLQLPLPRRSLGVEFWHRGKTDQYFVLIPRTTATPCSARQVFTTLHDNQEQVGHHTM